MKPSINFVLCGLTAGLLGHAGAAVAQSSVSIYGVMDVGVRRATNGDTPSSTSMINSGNMANRFGLRGEESIGQGLSAGFVLEGALQVDTGQAGSAVTTGQLFNRVARVYLKDRRLGELRLGRDFQPVHNTLCAQGFDPFACAGLGNGGMTGSFRNPAVVTAAYGNPATNDNPLLNVSNAVQYALPEFGGFSGSLLYSMAEGGTSVQGNNRMFGGKVGYTAGPLKLAFARLHMHTPTAQQPFKDTLYGAVYDFSVVAVYGTLRRFEYGAERTSLGSLAVTAPVGSGVVKLKVTRANLGGSAAANDATLWALGYQHDLSKRTALYATAARLSNQGNAKFAIAGGASVTSLAGGFTSRGYEVGVRHSF